MQLAGKIVSLSIVMLLVASLLPTAFDQIFGVNTTGWENATVTVWKLTPLMSIIAVMLGIIAYAGLRLRGD